MKSKSHVFNVVKQAKKGLDGAMHFGLKVLFLFLFLGQFSSIFANSFGSATVLNEKRFSLLSSTSIASQHLLTIAQDVRDNSTDIDLEDDVEDDWNPLAANTSTESSFNNSFWKNDISSAHFSIPNLSKVAFFILYHSWKSFIF